MHTFYILLHSSVAFYRDNMDFQKDFLYVKHFVSIDCMLKMDIMTITAIALNVDSWSSAGGSINTVVLTSCVTWVNISR